MQAIRNFRFLGLLLSGVLGWAPDGAVGDEEPAAPAKDEPSLVRFLEPGKEPRHTLRYQLKKGTKGAACTEMKMTMSQEFPNGRKTKNSVPTMKINMNFEILDVAANGDMTYKFTFGSAKVARDEEGAIPGIADAVEKSLEGMKGLNGTVVTSSRGVTQKVDLAVPKEAPEALKKQLESMMQSIRSLSSPLPEEPVGVGGKWEVAQKVSNQGLDINQTIVCTVKEIKGDKVELDVALGQTAKALGRLPGVPENVDVKLKSLLGNGVGQMSLDLHDVIPKSSLEASTETVIEGTQNGMEFTVTTVMDLAMKVYPVEPESEAETEKKSEEN